MRGAADEVFCNAMQRPTVILFARAPRLGAVKRRLARGIGDRAALRFYVGTFAATARTYGFEDFRETHLGVGYARAVPISATRVIHVGVRSATLKIFHITGPEVPVGAPAVQVARMP